jgi:hypothetical protein
VLGAASLAALLVGPSFAFADQFLGLDFNNDGDCDPGGDFDMGRYYSAGEVGVDQTFEIFFGTGTPSFYGYGCLFCVRDSTHLESSVTWTYTSPPGSTETPLYTSTEPGFPIELSTYITSHTDWKYKCWLVSAYDLTFSNPVTVFPHVGGFFTFRPASEGPISWIFDLGDLHCSVQDIGFQTVTFLGPGQACSPPAATEQTSWGSVKALFR